MFSNSATSSSSTPSSSNKRKPDEALYSSNSNDSNSGDNEEQLHPAKRVNDSKPILASTPQATLSKVLPVEGDKIKFLQEEINKLFNILIAREIALNLIINTNTYNVQLANQLKADNEELKTQFEAKEKELQSQIATLINDREKDQEQHGTYEISSSNQLNEEMSEFANLQTQYNAIAAQYQDVCNRFNTRGEHLELLGNKIISLMKTIANKNTLLHETEHSKRVLEQELNNAKSKIESLQQILNPARTETPIITTLQSLTLGDMSHNVLFKAASTSTTTAVDAPVPADVSAFLSRP
jgi:chromosome segregation ATPase